MIRVPYPDRIIEVTEGHLNAMVRNSDERMTKDSDRGCFAQIAVVELASMDPAVPYHVEHNWLAAEKLLDSVEKA